jgi:serine/threonine protein kinase
MRTGLSFSLNYAAPEIILAQESGERTLGVHPAADVWALGVAAYELLSGKRTFAPGTPTSEIRNMISGRLPLPWEEYEPKQLRTLRHSVLSCLARNPAERPSAADIHNAWKNLLDFAAVKHTEVSA